MGRCIISPTVRVQGHQLPEPRLVWQTLMIGDEPGGQLLAACELFLVNNLMFIRYSMLMMLVIKCDSNASDCGEYVLSYLVEL